MSESLEQIAESLKASDKKVQLIYAFNGTGKTRLSRAFKKLIHPDEDEESLAKILYYNAFTEDLFYWDNDNAKLNIHPNDFTTLILKDLGQDQNVISHFQRYTDEKLTPEFNHTAEDPQDRDDSPSVTPFTGVSFSYKRGNEESKENIKISKGEESNFIWSVFHVIIEQAVTVLNVPEPDDRETDKFDALEYIFIDDPVSSLDENHLIQLAISIGSLIKSSKSELKFIITTHNPLFYNILYNEIGAKMGFILSKFDDGTFKLEDKKGDSNKSFSYHLHIKKILREAVESNDIQRYHFALLRNLYEKTANFLGYSRWSEILPGDQKPYASRIMNFYPHNTLSNSEISEPTEPEKKMVGLLLDNLDNYGYLNEE